MTAQERGSAVSVTPVGCDTLERLVKLRFLHQTQRAAKSVRSRGEPKTQKPQDTQLTATSAAAKRQNLCMQMADVIRRSGTGLERCARWKSAPGTMDPSEVSGLNGNSANAEVVAKDRVKAVSNLFCFTWSTRSTTPHLHRRWSYDASFLPLVLIMRGTSQMGWLVPPPRELTAPH